MFRGEAIIAACAAICTALISNGPDALTGQVLIDGGFEQLPYTVGTRPSSVGHWQGDLNAIVTRTDGIIPVDGDRMMQFIHTVPEGPSIRAGAEIWQLIDMAAYRDLIRSGRCAIVVSCWFNRVDAGPETDTEFGIGIGAYSGSVSSFPGQWQQTDLIYRQDNFVTDGDVNTWQRGVSRMVLPVQTDFITLNIRASENVVNEVEGEELAGHYCDRVQFRVVELPRNGNGGGGGGGGGFVPPPMGGGIVPMDHDRGGPWSVTVEGLEPGKAVWLLGSVEGIGETYVPAIGFNIDLINAQPIGRQVADPWGKAKFGGRIARAFPADRVWLQAVQREMVTPVLIVDVE